MMSTKTLNFVPLPKLANDPALDRRTRIIAQLEEQKLLLKDPTLHAAYPYLGKERARREDLSREKATRAALLAKTTRWHLRVFRSLRLEGNRI